LKNMLSWLQETQLLKLLCLNNSKIFFLVGLLFCPKIIELKKRNEKSCFIDMRFFKLAVNITALHEVASFGTDYFLFK